jgi:hypothetical protein
VGLGSSSDLLFVPQRFEGGDFGKSEIFLRLVSTGKDLALTG